MTDLFIDSAETFSTLRLLVGRQEEHQVYKNSVVVEVEVVAVLLVVVAVVVAVVVVVIVILLWPVATPLKFNR